MKLNSQIADHIEAERIQTAIDMGLSILQDTLQDRFYELVGETHYYLGYAFLYNGKWDISQQYFNEALTFWKNTTTPSLIDLRVSCLVYLGIINQTNAAWKSAKQYYEDALTYTSPNRFGGWELMTYHNLGIVYKALDQYPKALESYQHGLAKNRGNTNQEGHLLDSLQYLETLNALCGLFIDSDQPDSTLYYLDKTAQFLDDYPIAMQKALHLSYKGQFYEKKGFFELKDKWHEKSISLHQKALQIFKQEKDTLGILQSWINIGANHEYLAQYHNAINAYQLGEKFLAHGNTQDSAKLFMNLSDSYVQLDKEDLAQKYRDLCKNLNPNIQEILRYSQEKEVRSRIKTAKERKDRIHLMSILTMGSLFSLTIFLLAIRNMNQKKISAEFELANVNLEVENKNLEITQTQLKLQQKNLEMEQAFERAEREILKAQNKAKEQTLQKVSRLLHDDIGMGMSHLARQLKLFIPKLAENNIPTDSFSRLCHELNEYYEKVREMSHYMNRQYLLKGLIPSLMEFQHTVHNWGLHFELYHHRMKGVKFSSELELNVFRIIQEALQNAFKHAHAEMIEVQLTFQPPKTGLEDGLLTVTIEDNGRGFDVDTQEGGIGLKNMQERTEALNGHFSFDSVPGMGCTIIVEIPTPNYIKES